MWYFLDEHYQLSGGEFGISDILSASQPFEFDEKGHFDGKVLGNRRISTADSSMIWYWNEAIIKYKKFGIPKPIALINENNKNEFIKHNSNIFRLLKSLFIK